MSVKKSSTKSSTKSARSSSSASASASASASSSASSSSSSSSSSITKSTKSSSAIGALTKGPFYTPYASADHPEFKKPPRYLGGYSEQFYPMSLLVSAAQKSLRRSDEDLAIRVFAELARTGFANKGLEILITVAYEDVGPRSMIPVVRMLRADRAAFRRLCSASTSKAILNVEAMQIYMRAVLQVARAPHKSRAIACASGAAIGYAQSVVRPKYEGRAPLSVEKHLKAMWRHSIRQCVKSNLALHSSKNPKPRWETFGDFDVDPLTQEALGWSHMVYVATEEVEGKQGLTKLVQECYDTWPSDRASQLREGPTNSPRLQFFAMVLLVIWATPEWGIHESELDESGEHAELDAKSAIQRFISRSPTKRTIDMPDWVFDKHTATGKGSSASTVTGSGAGSVSATTAREKKQLAQLRKACNARKVDMDAIMTPAEQRYSHRVPPHIANGTNPMEYFFDHGARVSGSDRNPHHINPFHVPCGMWYLEYMNQLTDAEGLATRKAVALTKTKHMSASKKSNPPQKKSPKVTRTKRTRRREKKKTRRSVCALRRCNP